MAACNIRKVYGATIAVSDVSFDIHSGETHALLGENGAGKSTLVKLLAGLVQPTSGGFLVAGAPAILGSPGAAHGLGIQTAFQELTLVKDLSVLDNMLMPYPPTAFGLIRQRDGFRQVRDHLAVLGLETIDPRREVRDLDLNERQKIEIARAIFRKPRILLLDEPTSTLSGRDIDWLGDLIAQLKQQGVTIVFISHRMREVRAFCDRVTVLRNGTHVATELLSNVGDEELISMIAGRELGLAFPPKLSRSQPSGAPVLSVRDLGADRRLHGVSFDLMRGEILGVAGLQGMGQLELFWALFGMTESRGKIFVEGKRVTLTSPRDAVDARIGISLLPEDRKTEALFLKLDGQRNITLPVVERYTRFGLIDTAREARDASKILSRLNVQMRALWTDVKAFSGGNQQKIAIAKWLFAQSSVLLLFDPTRGIDVGTKREIYSLMQDYADAGGAILFHSTEISELDHLAHRVLVLYHGQVAADLEGDAIGEDAILRATLGAAQRARSVGDPDGLALQ